MSRISRLALEFTVAQAPHLLGEEARIALQALVKRLGAVRTTCGCHSSRA